MRKQDLNAVVGYRVRFRDCAKLVRVGRLHSVLTGPGVATECEIREADGTAHFVGARAVLGIVRETAPPCAKCGELWPCSDAQRTDILPALRAEHTAA